MQELVQYLLKNLYLDFQGDITMEQIRQFLRQDDSREARRVLARILDEQGVDDLLLTLADCLREQLADARFWYTRSSYIDPLAVGPHERLARLAMRENSTAAAIDEYTILCRLEPGNAGYWADCALAHHKLGNADQARECARKAVAIDPASPAASILHE